MIKAMFLVFIGGGVGSVSRFLLSFICSRVFESFFPISTLLVNMLGSFLIGTLSIILLNNFDMKNLLIIGFCGGFTTFSTFSLESLNLLRNGEIAYLFTYVASSIILCIIFVWLGMVLTELIFKK